ncbi:MAG: (Fe-S)-binding protein [Saprospiraceae bacterium]|nr:(Fe-S)-binding protein [Saprospiraceae bacterium]
MIQQFVFVLVSLTALAFAGKQFLRIRRNILLGKDAAVEPGQTAQRWQNVLLVAFGQQKMFKNWIPAIFHFFIYAAFLLTQVELAEIFIDGIFGVHRFFAPLLGGFYTFIINFIEILSVAAFVATLIFLSRRNLLRIPRFQKAEMKGWPTRDANLILLGEIVLLTGIFCMNGADVLLQQLDPDHYPATGTLAVSSWLGPMLFGSLSEPALHVVERFGWWLHILTVFAFLNYLPYSKHLHIILAFFNTYYARLKPRGEMDNMPEIMNEVKSMMGIGEPTNTDTIPEFGAKDVPGLSWKNVLDAYSCTECGRCTAACPANLTGKKLSPRKIMMDVRDRAEEIGKKLDSGSPDFIGAEWKDQGGVTLSAENFDDGRSLFDYIAREEIHACTTCNACVEACPVLINPLDIILQLRRYEILTESAGPGDWLPLFNSIENGGSAWAMSVDRDAWVRG